MEPLNVYVSAALVAALFTTGLAVSALGCGDADARRNSEEREKLIKQPHLPRNHLDLDCAYCCGQGASKKPLTGSMKDDRCECRGK